jgi:hypothetical protein
LNIGGKLKDINKERVKKVAESACKSSALGAADTAFATDFASFLLSQGLTNEQKTIIMEDGVLSDPGIQNREGVFSAIAIINATVLSEC